MKRVTFREDEILEKDLQGRYGSVVKRATIELMYTVKDLLPYTYMEAQICVMNTHYVSGPSPIVSFVTARGGKKFLPGVKEVNVSGPWAVLSFINLKNKVILTFMKVICQNTRIN